METTRSNAKAGDWVVYNNYEGEIVAIYTTWDEAIAKARETEYWSVGPFEYWDEAMEAMG